MYKNPAAQREFMRRQYYWKYWTDEAFREAEAIRKAEWYQRKRTAVLAQQGSYPKSVRVDKRPKSK